MHFNRRVSYSNLPLKLTPYPPKTFINRSIANSERQNAIYVPILYHKLKFGSKEISKKMPKEEEGGIKDNIPVVDPSKSKDQFGRGKDEVIKEMQAIMEHPIKVTTLFRKNFAYFNFFALQVTSIENLTAGTSKKRKNKSKKKSETNIKKRKGSFRILD